MELPESQSHPGRHKCACCAYEHGYSQKTSGASLVDMAECTHGNVAPLRLVSSLKFSQAGAGRHKCVICAFAAGYRDARLESAQPADYAQSLSRTHFSMSPVALPTAARQAPQAPSSKDWDELAEIGKLGEVLVLAYEQARLTKVGRIDLAEQIEHVAIVRGDGAGFDVRSFFEDGREMFIEVKTTTSGAGTAFFLTANELRFAGEHKEQYRLYRLYSFVRAEQTAKFFEITADALLSCPRVPQVYRVEINLEPGS